MKFEIFSEDMKITITDREKEVTMEISHREGKVMKGEEAIATLKELFGLMKTIVGSKEEDVTMIVDGVKVKT